MTVRAPKRFKTRRDQTDKNYLHLYRFSKSSLEWMAEYFLGPECERRGGAVTRLQKMKIFCRYMADPGFQTGVAEDIGVHQSTVSRQILSVMDAFLAKKDLWIHFPTSVEEIQNAKNLWQENKNIPSTVGAIDCTHVPVEKPAGAFGDEYVNRKGFASIIVQATCNAKCEFTSLDVSWPGSVHDSRVLRNSTIFRHLQDTRSSIILLGDEGYPLHPFLMTPFKTPRDDKERFYNKTHAKERVVIEKVFGQLKRRFPMLKYGVRLMSLKFVPADAICCAVLHNISKHLNEPDPNDEEETFEEEIHELHLDEDLNGEIQGQIRRNYS